MIQTITNWFMTTISLMTAVGIFMHDGRVDKATITALQDPLSFANDGSFATQVINLRHADGHTHPDFNPIKSLMHSFTYQSPSVPPRDRGERKKRLSLHFDVGRHAFDDVLMPII